MLRWLIVGGGIHGVHVAARLIGEAGVDPEKVRILDPRETLLARWQDRTRVTGMTHLRSPGVHHLGIRPFSLTKFAGQRRQRRPGVLRAPYDRPALELFEAHSRQVIERYDLCGLHLKGRAIHCEPREDGVRITTAEGLALEAERVILALGSGEQLAWPSWAPRKDPRIQHIFSENLCWPEPRACGSVLVLGGGISAAQVALRLADEGRPVHLVARHPMRIHLFDSDPGWLGPKNMSAFRRVRDCDQRRQILKEARHPGSMPPEVHQAIKRAEAKGSLVVHRGQIDGVQRIDQGLRLSFANGRHLEGRHLLLATGFGAGRPGGALVDQLIEKEGLACASCGYPIVDSSLRWHPRVHVTGPLAELRLGPTARNIAGARRAAERLTQLAAKSG